MSSSAGLDLFAMEALRRQREQVLQSREFSLCVEAALANLLEAPTEAVWEWAARNVWLSAKMAAEEGYYNPAKTPWTKEIQELPLRPDVRAAFFMKPSRSGGTEAGFNIIRWMPQNWPGNAGVVFPDEKQGRDVARRRLVDSITQLAGGQLSDDANDIGLSNLHLLNMLIKIGPSGAQRMFTEWWVRFFMLDEVEEHATTDSTTTVERALSRQVDVPDSLLYVLSKPKKAGGPIHLGYLSGSQKQWMHPCPRCERPFAFARGQFTNDHDCRNADGTWDLGLVEANTFCLCPHCQKRIYEREKASMNEAALWVPRSMRERLKGLDGRPVPLTPGWESYHLTDYSSYHPKVTWGALRVMELLAFEIQPKRTAQVHFINNHMGLPEEAEIISTDADTIALLMAGRVEERMVPQPDGSEVGERVTHGLPGGYSLAYLRGEFIARLPYAPTQILIFIDKQKTCLKYSVWSIRVDPRLPGQVEAHLIDLGRADDEDALRAEVIRRPYFIEGVDEPMYISAGFMDSRFRGQTVFKFCLALYFELGLQIWPVRGEGESSKWSRRGNHEHEVRSQDTVRGRVLRFVKDVCELGEITVRYFKDKPMQDELNDKLHRRPGWRAWLPNNYPAEFAAELIAEKYDKAADAWVHNEQKYGPNDYRDTMKMLCLWLLEHLNPLMASLGLSPGATPSEGVMEEPGAIFDSSLPEDVVQARVRALTRGVDNTIDELHDAPPIHARNYVLKPR